MPKISILWGETPEDGQKAKTYKFKTKAELEAFKFGVSEMNGWYDWEEVEEGYVFKYAQYYRREGI